MLNSTQLLSCFIGAVALIPCGICLIVWVYVLAMALFMRGATAADTDAQSIAARYALVFHDDLHTAVAQALRQMATGLLGALLLLTLWYFFAGPQELAQVRMLLGYLLLLGGGMWLLARFLGVIAVLSARTKTPAMGRLVRALEAGRGLHALMCVLTVAVNWLLTL